MPCDVPAMKLGLCILFEKKRWRPVVIINVRKSILKRKKKSTEVCSHFYLKTRIQMHSLARIRIKTF